MERAHRIVPTDTRARIRKRFFSGLFAGRRPSAGPPGRLRAPAILRIRAPRGRNSVFEWYGNRTSGKHERSERGRNFSIFLAKPKTGVGPIRSGEGLRGPTLAPRRGPPERVDVQECDLKSFPVKRRTRRSGPRGFWGNFEFFSDFRKRRIVPPGKNAKSRNYRIFFQVLKNGYTVSSDDAETEFGGICSFRRHFFSDVFFSKFAFGT